MRISIIDCYTDEPSGLGVPPYLGTYPRYIAGALLKEKHEVFYITIDDLRYLNKIPKEGRKTNIKTYNRSKNKDVQRILSTSNVFVVITGVQTPGKYLSALPGTLKEVSLLIEKYKALKILTGPASICGEGLFGGKFASKDYSKFDLIIPEFEYKVKEVLKNLEDVPLDNNYNKLKDIAKLGASIIKQFPDDNPIIELETSRGCGRKIGCSFCTEPLKNKNVEKREIKDIIEEVKALHNNGAKNFRFGKQTCFYNYGNPKELKKLLSTTKKYSEVLHIDNVNPAFVTEEKTKIIVANTTAGNVAALGVESFDEKVIKANNLNSNPETTMKAIKTINKYGSIRGKNGMPKFLPGINILFGLIGENKKTHEENMIYFNKILEENLLLRRINIRQVVLFENTPLYKYGMKSIHKNKKYYWKWRNQIRHEIDHEMLKKLMPIGTIMTNCRTEIHDGNTTFCRQTGTYPLIVGIKEKLPLKQVINVKITDHMLRSLVGTPN